MDTLTYEPETGFVWIGAHQIIKEDLTPSTFTRKQAKALAFSMGAEFKEEDSDSDE